MKEVGIITHYDVHNHGALLQLTALIRVLKSKGIEAKALQFDKNYDFMGPSLKAKYNPSIKSINIYWDYMREKGLACTKYNFRKRNILNSFKQREQLIGKFYTESKPLDGIIVGSDEVFALHTGPTPVFFGHCLPSDKIFAYAGSFGPTTYEDICRVHANDFISSGLQSMKYLTVRDANSAEVVEKLTSKRPPIVVDPVLLYGYQKEINNLSKPNETNYLLVYSYDNRMNSPEEVKAIKAYAHKKGLKILSPGFFHKWCDYNVNVDPISLLAYFKNASEVITDTFHGAVMSLITGAKFAVKTRESNHLKLYNLLKEYGVTDRIFTDWDKLEDTLNTDMDYNKINPEIERRRAESMKHLDNMLNILNSDTHEYK